MIKVLLIDGPLKGKLVDIDDATRMIHFAEPMEPKKLFAPSMRPRNEVASRLTYYVFPIVDDYCGAVMEWRASIHRTPSLLDPPAKPLESHT